MNYLQHHNSGRSSGFRGDRRSTRGFVIAAVVAVIVICLEWFAPHFFPALFTSIARPYWRTEFSIQSGSLQTPSAILAENESLKRQLTDATVRLATFEDVQNQNDAFKALMGRASSTAPRILAAILLRPPAMPYDEFVIDAGADQGFSSTSLVYAPGNVPIGRIADVLAQTSTVVLFSSPGARNDVLIGPNHIPATSVGHGGGQYSAELPQAATVSEGDMVVASGLAASVSAASAPIGIVSAVVRDPAQPFETVLFAPPVNIYELRWVLVDPENPTANSAAVKIPPAAVKTKK